MTVATFTQPDATAQLGSAYKANLDAASKVMSRIAASFAPHAQSTPDMTVRVDAGHVFGHNSGALTEVAAQSTGTITAPATNPRKDIVYVDRLTGTVGVATGTEAASPSDPAIPAGKVPIARVTLATSTTSIANSIIDDIRDLAGLGLSAFASQAEAEAGSENTKYMTPLRTAQAIAALAAAADQTARDIAMTALIAATSTGGVRGPVVSWVADADNFSTKTNATFATDHYHNPAPTSADGTWGDTDPNTSDPTWGDAVANGKNIGLLFPATATGTVASVKGKNTVTAAVNSSVVCKIYTNNAGSPGTQVGGDSDPVTWGGVTDETYTFTWSSNAPSLTSGSSYWAVFTDSGGVGNNLRFNRINDAGASYATGMADTITSISDGSGGASGDLEVEVNIAGAVPDMTLSDDAETITTGALTVDVYVTEKTVDASPTRRVRASIDGGSTWATGTLQETFSYPTGKNIYRYACDVSAQSGTSMKVEYNTLDDGKAREFYRVDAVALYP